jgi:hypothetical protein
LLLARLSASPTREIRCELELYPDSRRRGGPCGLTTPRKGDYFSSQVIEKAATMTRSDYFAGRAEERRQALADFRASGLRHFQFTDQGEIEITGQIEQEIQSEIDEYLRCVELFK